MPNNAAFYGKRALPQCCCWQKGLFWIPVTTFSAICVHTRQVLWLLHNSKQGIARGGSQTETRQKNPSVEKTLIAHCLCEVLQGQLLTQVLGMVIWSSGLLYKSFFPSHITLSVVFPFQLPQFPGWGPGVMPTPEQGHPSCTCGIMSKSGKSSRGEAEPSGSVDVHTKMML